MTEPRANRRLQGAESMHPRLRELFAAWQRQALRWTLLRAPATPAAPTGDIDILVAPADANALREVAVGLGFVALPGSDSKPDLLMLGHDAHSGQWLLLDITTTISFRSPRLWQPAGVTERVLSRRCAVEDTALPDDGDAFWLLLLHCVLDKRSIAEHYRARLWRLAAAGSGSSIGFAVCAAAGGRSTPGAFLAATRAQEWEVVSDLGQQLSAELRRRQTIRGRARAFGASMRATLSKPRLLRRRRGLSIALLGPNGVGKSTAAAGLQHAFPFRSRVLYMGLWKAAGRGCDDRRVPASLEIASRPLRLWSRYLVAQYHQLRGRLVIFDRYVYEALLPPKPPLAALKRVYYWLLVHLIPRPAIVVVLDAPGRVAYARKQENPPHELDYERRMYAAFSERIPRLERIDAAAPCEVVHARISVLVWEGLQRRWRPGPSL